MLAERRPDTGIEIRLDGIEQKIWKAVVFHHKSLSLETAIREIQNAGYGGSFRLTHTALSRVRAHGNEVCIAAPVHSEQRAEHGKRPVLIAGSQQQFGRSQ